MVLSDILGSPYLIFLGITLVLIGVVGYFFMTRLNEQNHKINSMFDLVKTMAEEIETQKYNTFSLNKSVSNLISNTNDVQLNNNTNVDTIDHNHLNNNRFKEINDLISVSDGTEEDNVSYNDSDVSSNYSEEEEDEEDEYEEDENIIELSDFDKKDDVKHIVLNYDELSEENMSDVENEKSISASEMDEYNLSEDDMSLHTEENVEDSLDEVEELQQEEISEIKEEPIEEVKHLEEKDDLTDLSILKTINIDDNLENIQIDGSVDYKKLSVKELKTIAIEKGLANENTKLKKNELLKLLGDE